MSSRIVLPAKEVGETYTQTFYFASSLSSLEIINTASTTCSVYSGVDANPSAVISGVSTPATQVVSQNFTGGVVGTIYSIKCTAVTSLGQTLVQLAYLAVIPDLP